MLVCACTRAQKTSAMRVSSLQVLRNLGAALLFCDSAEGKDAKIWGKMLTTRGNWTGSSPFLTVLYIKTDRNAPFLTACFMGATITSPSL